MLSGVQLGQIKLFIAYSNDALSAWVKQRSPGCAAASVAGAWNALGGLKRQDKGARTMDDNIGVLKQIQQDRVTTLVAESNASRKCKHRTCFGRYEKTFDGQTQ